MSSGKVSYTSGVEIEAVAQALGEPVSRCRVYEELFKRAEGHGCRVDFGLPGIFMNVHPGELGWFKPDGQRLFTRTGPAGFGPKILVWRRGENVAANDLWNKPGDVLQELITLAHELGHFRSFQRGERADEYEAAIADRSIVGYGDLPEPAKLAILDEEQRAWRYARAELRSTAFDCWDEFEQRECDGLADYRQVLGLL